MTKAILLSIKPEWLAKIRSGKKTREIRKNKPSCQLPISVYMYCTKDTDNYKWLGQKECEGKVVGKFTLKEVEKIDFDFMNDFVGQEPQETGSMEYYITVGELEKAQMSYEELKAYGKGKPLFAWHISDLVIFDEPKELREFHPYFPKLERWCHEDSDCSGCPFLNSAEKCRWLNGLTKAPQSWQYVEVGE